MAPLTVQWSSGKSRFVCPTRWKTFDVTLNINGQLTRNDEGAVSLAGQYSAKRVDGIDLGEQAEITGKWHGAVSNRDRLGQCPRGQRPCIKKLISPK